ncbi:hypothetical protein [Enterococcus sp.]|uniref:hypothetical protein n=1 Tax=Enterococcus sp. TaxID=35783 RepID=UPI002FCB7F99
MNFISYKVDNSKKLKKMKKEKPSYFKRGGKASVFLYNEQSNGLVHVILKLNDEYLIRTRLFNEYTSIPFDHYINVFFNIRNSNVFIEESLSVYLQVAIEFLEERNGVSIDQKILTNEIFINLTNKFLNNSSVTRLEYIDKIDDIDKELEFVSEKEFKRLIQNDITIEFMTWRFSDFYASANINGKIKLDNSNDEFLVKWLGVFSDVI